jgi:hypothetical protein
MATCAARAELACKPRRALSQSEYGHRPHWLFPRETASILAIKLADTWLLFNNSQRTRNHFKTRRKSSRKILHNSQKIYIRPEQPVTTSQSTQSALANQASNTAP